MSETTSNNNVNGNYNHRRKRRFRGRKLSTEKKDSLKSVSTNASTSKEVSVEKKNTSLVGTKKDFTKTSTSKRKKNRNAKNSENSKKQSVKKEEFKRSFIKKEFNKYKKTKSASRNVSGKIKKEDLPYRTESLPASVCPICNKSITNMMTALLDETSEGYAHFDCVYDKLKARVTLKESERLSYIGNGAFAIIEDYKDGQALKFRIKQQFQFSEPRSTK